MWLQLATVTSQALEYDVINFFSAWLSNFMQCFIGPQRPVSTTVHPIYLRYTLTWAHKCNQLFFILYKIHSQVSANTACTNLWERLHITSSNRGEWGFVARFTFSSYTIWKSKSHYFRQNYTTMKTYLWTIWNSNRLFSGVTPGQQRHSGSSHDLSWLIATGRALCHWNFHLLSFWLALSLLCDVSYVTVNEKFWW